MTAPLLSSCATSKHHDASTKVDDLSEILSKVRNEANLPAIAAAAMKDGKLLALGAVGVRKVGDPTPLTSADKFHIGSCTKAMTATLAAMFVERGKLRWTDTLADIFPERAAKMDPDYRRVTLEMLLNHRAGTPANADLGLLFPDVLRRLFRLEYSHPDYPLAPQRLAFMEAVLAKPPETKPGTTFTYSNAGYIFVGAILERITNQSWERLIQQRLFKSLKMRSAGFGPPSRPDAADQPWAHILRDGKYKPIYGDNPPALGPAGTVHCNLADYLKFADFHASLGARPKGLLSPESFERLHKPWPDSASSTGTEDQPNKKERINYAFGWAVFERQWARGIALSHHGSNTMNYFIVWVAPKIGLSFAIATNAGGDQMAETLDRIAGELVRRFA